VDRAGQPALAGPRFADEQDRNARLGRQPSLLDHLPHAGQLTGELGEAEPPPFAQADERFREG
jgi:hypothetical protein